MTDPQGNIWIFTVAIIAALFVAGMVSSLMYVNERRRSRHHVKLKLMSEGLSKTLMETKAEIQEQTMNQIARELHDDLATVASLINIHLSIMEPENVEETKEKITHIRELNMHVLNKTRTYSHILNSDLIKEIGFAKALHNMLDRLSAIKGLRVHVHITGKEYRLNSAQETIVFRICQEVLNNALKHAEAKTITVRLNYLPGSLAIEIQDDGVGFDLNNRASGEQGIGWLNIKNRSKMINAAINLESEKWKGTKFSMNIPVLKGERYVG